MSNVCVVLPSTPKDVVWLPYALMSIAAQTLRPAMVSIQLSGFVGCTPDPLRVLNIDNPMQVFHMPVVVHCTTKKLSCGGGRNAAVGHCGPGIDFFKYFDADDEMMPYQLQRMVSLMHKHNASIGYHGYFPKDSGPVVRDDAQLRERIRNDGGRWKKFSPFHELQTQHGQPMIRAAAWRPLDERNTFAEDTRMAREAWAEKNVTFVHTTERLTRYMRRHAGRAGRKWRRARGM